MPSRKIQIVVLFVAIFCCRLIAAAQEEKPPKPTGNSIISGRVIYADTGRAVRRASVMLFNDLSRGPVRVTAANARGEFRFSELAGDSYFVVADAPGIISPSSVISITEVGVGGNHEADYTRVTVDGKSASRCEIKAVRAGTIKGTITYSDKEPVVSNRVMIYRRRGGTVAPFYLRPVVTNDRGMYRLDGLPDGEYFIGIANGETSVGGNNRSELNGLANAFYPGVRSLADAKAVQVESGTEITDVSFTVNDDDLHQISGLVTWRGSNEPLTEGGLTLRRKGDPTVDVSFANLMRLAARGDDDANLMDTLTLFVMNMPAAVQVNEKGEWMFKDVPPGTYVITAVGQLREPAKNEEKDPSGAPRPRESEPRYVSRQVELTVDQEDLKDIKIELSDGGRIFGVVVADDSAAPKPVLISVNQKDEESFLPNMPQSSKPDGTFMIDGVPAGEVRIDVDVSAREGLYLKSITAGSQDLMREPLRMEEGAQVSGIRITLGAGLATFTGRVGLSDGGSAAGAGVLLVPADPALWHLQSLHLFATTDANGTFKLECPPGDYLVFTWGSRNRPLQRIEDFVRSQAANARRITLQSKEEKVMELTIASPRKD